MIEKEKREEKERKKDVGRRNVEHCLNGTSEINHKGISRVEQEFTRTDEIDV